MPELPVPEPLKPAQPVLILFGPTASGKTAVLEDIFIRDRLCPAEIISADSMQVYRGMDIGTAKPSAEDRAKIPHHLIDIRSPDEQFHAGDFVRLAAEACAGAAGRGALPVISGGTGFYLKNFVLGLPGAPPSDPVIRAQLIEELARRGAGSLMEELAACDPPSAARIHINDEYRLLRALEVFRSSGRPLSSFNVPGEGAAGSPDQDQRNLWFRRNHKFRWNLRFRFLILGLRRQREELYRRINARCAAMFRGGLPAEVRRLYEAGYTPRDPGLRAIGYREFFVEGESGGFRLSADLAGVESLAAQNSRRYAKRQMTFFAPLPGVKWIDADGPRSPADQIRREIEGFLPAL